MPAYLKPIYPRTCDRRGCDRLASVTLFNSANAEIGDYCTAHKGDALVRFNAGLTP